MHVLAPSLISAQSVGLFALLLQSRPSGKTWPGSPHLATGLHGGICIQIDSSGGMTAAAQNRFYTWPPEP